MKIWLTITIVILFGCISFGQKFILTVNVTGIKPVSGKLEMALYNKSSDFPKNTMSSEKQYKIFLLDH